MSHQWNPWGGGGGGGGGGGEVQGGREEGGDWFYYIINKVNQQSLLVTSLIKLIKILSVAQVWLMSKKKQMTYVLYSYHCDSVLTFGMTCWGGNTSNHDKNRLDKNISHSFQWPFKHTINKQANKHNTQWQQLDRQGCWDDEAGIKWRHVCEWMGGLLCKWTGGRVGMWVVGCSCNVLCMWLIMLSSILYCFKQNTLSLSLSHTHTHTHRVVLTYNP